jgi:hypothetical protein
MSERTSGSLPWRAWGCRRWPSVTEQQPMSSKLWKVRIFRDLRILSFILWKGASTPKSHHPALLPACPPSPPAQLAVHKNPIFLVKGGLFKIKRHPGKLEKQTTPAVGAKASRHTFFHVLIVDKYLWNRCTQYSCDFLLFRPSLSSVSCFLKVVHHLNSSKLKYPDYLVSFYLHKILC